MVGLFRDDCFQGHVHHTNKSIDFGTTYNNPNYAHSFNESSGATQRANLSEIISNGVNGNPRYGNVTHGKQKGVIYIIKVL